MIRGYHGFSDWQIMKLDTDDLANEYTFGIELEVQKHQSEIACERMSDILEQEFGILFIYERDGSIGNGFEIISQPMTWNWFKVNIAKFKKLFELLNNANYRSHNGNACGLHMHISKKGLGLTTSEQEELREQNIEEYRINLLQNERVSDVATNINIQLERFKHEFFKFSRRKEFDCRWCRYLDADITLENGHDFINKEYIKANTKPAILNGGTHEQRYKALNLTNHKTVELRLFRGTLKWTTFYFTLNLMNNLVFYSKLENCVVSWTDLVFRGLTNREKVLCKAYCAERNIDLERNAVVSIGVNKNRQISIDKRELLNAVMSDD